MTFIWPNAGDIYDHWLPMRWQRNVNLTTPLPETDLAFLTHFKWSKMEFLLSDFWADHFRHLYRRHRREPVRLCRPPLRRCPRLRHLHGTLVRHSGTNDIKLFLPKPTNLWIREQFWCKWLHEFSSWQIWIRKIGRGGDQWSSLVEGGGEQYQTLSFCNDRY